MPLIQDPTTGENRFVMPANVNIGRDIEDIVAPRVRLPTGRPIGINHFIDVDLGADLGQAWAGAHYFRWTIEEGRGTWRQQGYFNDPLDSIAFSDADTVFDDFGKGRAPFRVYGVSAPLPSQPMGNRLWGATFRGQDLFITANTVGASLFAATGSDVPVISTIPGFAMPAGATMPMCMISGQNQGSPALYIGYNQAAAGSLDMLVDLNNPPTKTNIPITTGPTFGLCQTSVDGASLQVYASDGGTGAKVYMINTDVAPGAATIRPGVALPPWGYTVGVVNVNPNPEVWYVVPVNGGIFLDAGGGAPFVQSLFRGKLVRVDQRAFTVYDVATSTTFVLYATSGRFGVFYCDGISHYYMTKGSDIRVAAEEDRPITNANVTRLCRGHWHRDDKFYWEENWVDSTSVLNTVAVRYEYDIYTNRAFPISREMTFGSIGIVSQGSPLLPWLGNSGYMLSGSYNEWVFQFQPPRGRAGYSYVHTDGSSATSGKPFESSHFFTTPDMTHKDHPRAKYRVCNIIGPNIREIRKGSGAEAGMNYHNAQVTVDVTGCPQAVFYGDDNYGGRGKYPFVNQDSWSDSLQATITGYSDTSGANAARYAIIPYPVTIEGVFVEDGFSMPSKESLMELFGVADAD